MLQVQSAFNKMLGVKGNSFFFLMLSVIVNAVKWYKNIFWQQVGEYQNKTVQLEYLFKVGKGKVLMDIIFRSDLQGCTEQSKNS